MNGRPTLDLGPLTGSPEYCLQRAQQLVETFRVILGKSLEFRNDTVGNTDGQTYVAAPWDDPELLLIVEHELSHLLFGSNVTTATTFAETVAERLLRRAGWTLSNAPTGYREKLTKLAMMCWNLLEDHRCRGLWQELYYGGGELLRQRWHDIAKFQMEEQAKVDLLAYLGRAAAYGNTPDAPASFQRCERPVTKYKNMVEGVDSLACLALTARMIDEIADELLDSYPPDPKAEASQKVKVLVDGVLSPPSGSGGPEQPPKDQMGGGDVKPPPGKPKVSANEQNKIRIALTANDRDIDEGGMTPLDRILSEGANEMQKKVDEARKAMLSAKASSQEQAEQHLTSLCEDSKIRGTHIEVPNDLPRPSGAAQQIRKHLDQIRMNRRIKRVPDGEELDIDAYLEFLLDKEALGLDDSEEADLFTLQVKEKGLELLLLLDISGSMSGTGGAILDQAISDIQAGCSSGNKFKLHVWGFAHFLVFLKKPGSISTRISGATLIAQALDVAADWARSSPSTRAVIMITDGQPTSLRSGKKPTTGNPIKDVENIIQEMRSDGIVLSVLAFGPSSMGKYFQNAFGKAQFGHVTSLADLGPALVQTAKILVSNHISRSA